MGAEFGTDAGRQPEIARVPGHVLADRFSGDWRPTILAILSMILYLAILVDPGLRQFFELEALSWWDCALIGGLAAIWAYLLRWIWRRRILERFLNTDFGSRVN